MKRWISRLILRLLGWKIKGAIPHYLRKYIIVVIPHTSNWDFPLGLLVRAATGLKVKFVAKDSLFRFPFGWIFRALGGYPVVRSRNTNFVEAVAAIFESKEAFCVCLTPEGTRSRVEQLKTGFYYMAREAEVPIVMVRFDYGPREVTFAEPIRADQPYEQVLEQMRSFFAPAQGKVPENAWP